MSQAFRMIAAWVVLAIAPALGAGTALATPRRFDRELLGIAWGDHMAKVLNRFKIDSKDATFDGSTLAFPTTVAGLDVRLAFTMTKEKKVEGARLVRRVRRGHLCSEFLAFRDALVIKFGDSDLSAQLTTETASMSSAACEALVSGGRDLALAWTGETYVCSLASFVEEFGQRFVVLDCVSRIPPPIPKKYWRVEDLAAEL